MKEETILKAVQYVMGGLIAYFYSLNWELIFIWIILMFIDIITGILKGAKTKDFTSRNMKVGLIKKAGEFFLLFALLLCQRVAQINNMDVPIGTVFIGAFCFKELSSIIENSIVLDIGIPSVIMNWFKESNDSLNDNKNEND